MYIKQTSKEAKARREPMVEVRVEELELPAFLRFEFHDEYVKKKEKEKEFVFKLSFIHYFTDFFFNEQTRHALTRLLLYVC